VLLSSTADAQPPRCPNLRALNGKCANPAVVEDATNRAMIVSTVRNSYFGTPIGTIGGFFIPFERLFRERGGSAAVGDVSDARLKRDVVLLGRLANGFGLYRYRYLWSNQRYVGVMAQEVALIRADAVEKGPDGYLRVNYARLDMRLQTWEEWKAASRIVWPPQLAQSLADIAASQRDVRLTPKSGHSGDGLIRTDAAL
jgi:endosialidase-like protein